MRMARQIPVGTAYAVCIGALGVAVLGMVLFGERASPARLTCIGLIVAGGIGLKPVSWFPRAYGVADGRVTPRVPGRWARGAVGSRSGCGAGDGECCRAGRSQSR